ncbi:MAG: tyrosine-type recombinase/integrase [Candidatus Kariarchaeaceae archaeon]|jgi:site-specific recombinase XerD
MTSKSDADVMLKFLQYKSSLSKTTQRNYRYGLKQLSRYSEKIGCSLLSITEEEISGFLGLYDFKSTKETYRIIFNIFYKWCVKKKLSSENPVEEIKVTHGKKKIVEPMKTIDYRRIKKRCQGLREMTIVNCFWYTGVRAKELRYMRLEDIDLKKNMISISKSKTTSGYRLIPIHPNFKFLLEQYLRKRMNLKINEPWLFLTKHGTQFRERTLIHLITHLQYDLEVQFSCHDFRRAFITRLYNKTKDLVLCQRLAGHASIKTTQRYIIDDIEEHVRTFNSLNF